MGAPRVDIPELAIVRKQFTSKYGKKFDENAMGNVGGVLNERVVTKLSVQPPAAYLVQTYLEQICEKYEVEWSPNYRLSAAQMGEPLPPPQAPGGCNSSGNNDGGDFNEPDIHLPKAPESNRSTTIAPPPAPNTKTTTDKTDDEDDTNNDSSNDQPQSSGGKDSASYDDLAARFENLKNL